MPAAAARPRPGRDRPRRRRQAVGRADRAPVPAGVRHVGRGRELHDAATLGDPPAAGRLAFSTDSYVVRPLFFPGGCIGDLAVNGTVNDLAMSGAVPIALVAGFILEEGLELRRARARSSSAMGAAAARRRGPRSSPATPRSSTRATADGLYINTAGVGRGPRRGRHPPDAGPPGRRGRSSAGPIGLHGVAVMSQREGLEFGTEIRTDSAPLQRAGRGDARRVRRPARAARPDPRRAGRVAVRDRRGGRRRRRVRRAALPVPDEVAAACSFLGLDPMHVANEGKLVAVRRRRGDRRRRAGGDAGARGRGGTRASSAGSSTRTRAWSWPAPRSARPGSSTCRSASSSRGSAEAREVRPGPGSARPRGLPPDG